MAESKSQPLVRVLGKSYPHLPVSVSEKRDTRTDWWRNKEI